jgi:heterodisulfide reductase subunit A-like polyferredoxin
LCEPACLAGAVIHDEKPRSLDLEVGAVILAPGASAFDTKKLGQLPIRRSSGGDYQPGVRAHPEPLGALSWATWCGPEMKAEPKSIAWIQCVGSRNVKPGANSYCSSVCCMYAIKQALVAKEHSDGDLDCTIFNMDMRTFGKDYELYYNRAKDQGVDFIKARVHTIYGDDEESGGVRIEYATDQGEARSDHFDMAILSVGLETSGQVHEMAQRLGVKLSGDRIHPNPVPSAR